MGRVTGLRCSQVVLGATVRMSSGPVPVDPPLRPPYTAPPPSTPAAPYPANLAVESVSPLTLGCLAEQWSGKKGDTAALGGKKSKKKSSRAKASGGGSKQRKELGGIEGDPSPEEDEGIQKASPLTHSPPDEL